MSACVLPMARVASLSLPLSDPICAFSLSPSPPMVTICSTLASNIRTRRGGKVAINVPIFHDTNTPRPFIDPSIPYDRDLYPGDSEAKDGAALPDHIYMDAMAFGMGCCCLQITFQASDLQEATRVYDALVPVAPIMVGPNRSSGRVGSRPVIVADCRLVVRSSCSSRCRLPRQRIEAISRTLTVAGT